MKKHQKEINLLTSQMRDIVDQVVKLELLGDTLLEKRLALQHDYTLIRPLLEGWGLGKWITIDEPHHSYRGGRRVVVTYPNGLKLSVITGREANCDTETFEAVCIRGNKCDYSFTRGDVGNYLSSVEVLDLSRKIEETEV